MKHYLSSIALLLASCAGSGAVPRADVPPARPAYEPSARAETTDEAATRRWLDEQIRRQREGQGAEVSVGGAAPVEPVAVQRVEPVRPTDEEATKRWLEQTAAERRIAAEPPPPLPQEPQVVYVDRPVYQSVGVGYDYCGEPYYRAYYPRYGYAGPAPVNTLVGAGIGALVSNHKHRGQGAAIGAGVGLLFDLARWSRY